MKRGKFVYRDRASLKKMHQFYDKAMDALQIKYRETYIRTSIGKTHIIIAGDETKSPILTLHGGNGITPLNLRLFRSLLSRYCIIAPDVIGMPGKSEPFRNLHSDREDYGNWLCEILDSMNIKAIPFVVSSYSAAMMLSLAKVSPERIEKAVLLVPSGIAHGALIPIIRRMAIPFMKYYYQPSEETLKKIFAVMSDQDDALWTEFFDLMMSSYKMEMRPPKEYTQSELQRFHAPVLIFASDGDIFFPAFKVIPKAKQIFPERPVCCRITGKHLPSDETMQMVCRKIVVFLNFGKDE